LNSDDRGEAAIAALASMFDSAEPHPVDHHGNGMTNASRTKPYDWVLADAELAPLAIPTVLGMSVFQAGAVIDTRVYVPLAEIAPAMMDDSGAPMMQHMAVVRDFCIDASP
jgi:hypothetical protein